MYEIFKNALKGNYELVDMLNKIAEYYIKGNLSKEEKEELEDEARTNANPVNSYEYPQGWEEVTEQTGENL